MTNYFSFLCLTSTSIISFSKTLCGLTSYETKKRVTKSIHLLVTIKRNFPDQGWELSGFVYKHKYLEGNSTTFLYNKISRVVSTLG